MGKLSDIVPVPHRRGAVVFTRFGIPLRLPRTGRGSFSFAFLRRGSFRPALRDHIAAPPVATLGKLDFMAATGADQATAAKPQAGKAALVSRCSAAG